MSHKYRFSFLQFSRKIKYSTLIARDDDKRMINALDANCRQFLSCVKSASTYYSILIP